jgi:hypothetical protein
MARVLADQMGDEMSAALRIAQKARQDRKSVV